MFPKNTNVTPQVQANNYGHGFNGFNQNDTINMILNSSAMASKKVNRQVKGQYKGNQSLSLNIEDPQTSISTKEAQAYYSSAVNA